MKLEKEMINWVVDFAKQEGRKPSLSDLKDAGYTREMVRTRFVGLEGLLNEASKFGLNKFVLMDSDFNGDNNVESLLDAPSKYKRFIISTAESGSKVNLNFLNSLKNYAKRNSAKLLIIPLGSDWTEIDPALKGETFVSMDVNLNNNVLISSVQLNAKSSNPASSLSRIGNRSQSIVYGATKLSKEVVATPGKHPHLIITTGAVTVGNYKKAGSKTTSFSKNDWLATNEHELSAIVVEVVDNTFFHQRELVADVDGSIVDMSPKGAFRYHKDGKVSKELAVAMSVGDWHSGETSEAAYNSFPQISKLSGAKMTFLHDVLSFGQISHHDHGKEITKAIKAESGSLDFKKEINRLANDLNMWKRFSSKLMIVESNHDKHLDQSIESGAFWEDLFNRRHYLELALAMLDGKDPLKEALSRYAKFNLVGVEFVGPNNPVILNSKFGTLNLSSHGHEGGNGAKKAGAKSLFQSIGSAVTGHTHTPRIYPGTNGGMWVNGTSTCTDGEEVPPYAKGNVASSWLKTSTLVFQKNGGKFLRQQITLMPDGKWHLDQGKIKDVEDKIFKSEVKKCA